MQIYKLSQWRQLRGYSQEELAVKVGVRGRTIANYENSVENLKKASYSTIQKIADVLDIKISQIFLDSDSVLPK